MAMFGVDLVVFDAAADHAGNRTADGESGGTQEKKIRDEAQKGILAAVEQGEGAGEAADEGDDSNGNDEAMIFAEVFAVASDGGELARPEGDGSGGVGLDGEKAGFQQRGENEESAAACNGVDEAAEASCEGQENVLEERGVHW
jgi:hypothetical protein